MRQIKESVEIKTEKGQFDDSELLTLFEITKTDIRKLKLRFSDELKGTCMTIHSPTKASMTTTGSQRMILLEPALSSTALFIKTLVR